MSDAGRMGEIKFGKIFKNFFKKSLKFKKICGIVLSDLFGNYEIRKLRNNTIRK